MKTKILKRILAIMLSASTVMTMSGLVMAGPDDKPKKMLGQKRLRDEENESEGEEEEEEEEGYSMHESFSDDEEEDYDEDKHHEYPLYGDDEEKEEKEENKAENISSKTQISEFEALLNKPIESDVDGKEFASVVMNMLKVKLLKDSMKSNLYRIMPLLLQCSGYDKARANVAGALRDFAQKGLFNGFKEGQVNELIDILKRCAQTDEARANVARALGNFAQKGLFNGFGVGQSSELIDILNICAQTDKARANVADSLNCIGGGFWDEANEKQIGVLIDTLNKCAQTGKACSKVAFTVGEFIQNGLLIRCTTQQISAISAVLIECSKDENAQSKVSYSLRILTNELLKCSRDENALPKVKEIALDIIGQLIKKANYDVLKWKISYVISNFSSNGLINRLSEDKVLEIINFLASCADDMDAKEYVASSIASLALNNCLNSFKGQPEKLLTLVDILDRCFKLEDSEKNKNFIFFVKCRVARSLQSLVLGKAKVSYGTELCDNISSFYEDPKSENSQQFLDRLIQNSFFKDLTEEGKERLKKLLGDCLRYFD